MHGAWAWRVRSLTTILLFAGWVGVSWAAANVEASFWATMCAQGEDQAAYGTTDRAGNGTNTTQGRFAQASWPSTRPRRTVMGVFPSMFVPTISGFTLFVVFVVMMLMWKGPCCARKRARGSDGTREPKPASSFGSDDGAAHPFVELELRAVLGGGATTHDAFGGRGSGRSIDGSSSS